MNAATKQQTRRIINYGKGWWNKELQKEILEPVDCQSVHGGLR